MEAEDTSGWLNDLWCYDGTNWTWVSGGNAFDQSGVYGTKGVPAPANTPGARSGSVSWVDADGHFWLFGGDHSNPTAFTNDLWRYDGTNSTWVSGSSGTDQRGNYGTKGVRAASNVPGARTGAVSWIDDEGNLWLFGGWGLDRNGEEGSLNDLWRYTP